MAGLFGKMPAAGDFVSRGLPRGAGPVLDRWLTHHLAVEAGDPRRWPETGIRALIDGPNAQLVLLILPSADRSGRPFPLAAADAAWSVGHAEADVWGDTALLPLTKAAAGELSVDSVARALAQLRPPPAGASPLVPPLVWAEGHGEAAPGEGLGALLRPVSSG